MTSPLTWCDMPYSLDGLYNGTTQSDMAIVGIPMEAGATGRTGQDAAPMAIRMLESFETWNDPVLGDLSTLKVVDVGDASISRTQPHEDMKASASWLQEIAANTDCLVTLGGDHSITSFVLETIVNLYNDIHLIHIDAHGDTWPLEYEEALYPGHESWVPWVADKGYVNRVTQVGMRSVGPNMPARHVGPGRYSQFPGNVLMSEIHDIRAYLGTDKNPVYLSVDMDVVEPAMCPGVAYPEPGGWLPGTLLESIKTIVSSGHVVGVDIVETTPSLDRENLSVRLAHRSVLAVMRGLKLASV